MWYGEVSCFITISVVLYDAILYCFVVAEFFVVVVAIIEMLASAPILECTDIAYAMLHFEIITSVFPKESRSS